MKTPARFLVVGTLLIALGFIQGVALGQGMPAPGPEHELLKKQAGTWNATVRMQGNLSHGTSTSTMACGGLWLITEFRGTFGDFEFEGRGFDGYDPIKKKYVGVWVDAWSTTPMHVEGTYDPAKKTLTMTGESRGPGGGPVRNRMVTHYPDDDRYTFTLYSTGPDGEEIQVMTIEYARKK